MRTDDDPISDDDATSTSSEADGVFEAEEETPDAALESYSEVLSGVMDDHDSDSTGELELPGMNDDLKPRPAKSDPGFDGWLDDNQVTSAGDDPYAALGDADDDAAAEIADWVAFTSGDGDESGDPGETDVVVDVTDDSIAAVSADGSENNSGEPGAEDPEDTAEEPHEDTIEFFLDDASAASEAENRTTAPSAADNLVDESEDEDESGPEFDGDSGGSSQSESGVPASIRAADQSVEDSGDEPAEAPTSGPENGTGHDQPIDPDELMVLPVVSVAAAAKHTESESSDHDPESAQANDGDDTGEIPIVGGASSDADHESTSDAPVYDFNDFADDQYLQKATREHQDLAAAIDAADSEDTEQVAVSAAIPGLESGVVGFDDVVAAGEGDAAVPAAPRQSSDLLVRVGTGVALVAAFLLSLLWRPAITVLALAAFVVAAGEFYSALMHRRYKPMSIFGFVGIISAGLGAVVWGVVAIPIAFGLLATVILLYGAVSHRRMGAVSGFALTMLVAGWIGGFGAFAFPIIAAEDFQVLVLVVVGIVALVDIAAYFVGSSIGRRHFAPTISPKKTIEGLVGGTFMALVAGAAASFFVEAIDLPTGLVLGAVIAVVAPLGDLAVSVIKRSLNIKDMGSILPGHGGLLDRIDAIIAVVPAAWAVFVWTGLL